MAYLGHIVTRNEVRPNPDKIQAIQEYPIRKTTKEIKAFLGLLGYYRRFISDFARITKPLALCFKKRKLINIDDEEQNKCFENCKKLLINDLILQYPNFTQQFILSTDASDYAIGVVLSQKKIDGKDRPIAYASRTLNTHECNHCTTEKELLAIV